MDRKYHLPWPFMYLERYVATYAATITRTCNSHATWMAWKLEKTFPGRDPGKIRYKLESVTPAIIQTGLMIEGEKKRPSLWVGLAIGCFVVLAVGAAIKGWMITAMVGTVMAIINLVLLARYKKAAG